MSREGGGVQDTGGCILKLGEPPFPGSPDLSGHDFGDFRVEIASNGIAHVVLGHPGKMPSTGIGGHAALARLWPQLAEAREVRSILIRSEGKGFCAGGSPELVQELLKSAPARLRVLAEIRAIVQGMIDCDKPIVSAINGAAVGAGLALALLADISIAARDAKLIDGHTKIGVAAGDHSVVIWPLLCGLAKSKYYLLLSESLTGQEAERIGLVSLSVEASQLTRVSQEIAERLARGSAAAQAFTKRTLNHWLRSAWPAFEHSAALEILGFAQPDAVEGVTALAEKRAPHFDGTG
jgi:enoyl-CoA hydratase